MDVKYNQETVRVYYFKYMREYRAIAVLWGLLTMIWCILNIVTFVQPQWIGDTAESSGYGHLGIYSKCEPNLEKRRYTCSGTFLNFKTLPNKVFQAVTFLVGISVLLMLICTAALLLFFCFKKKFVFIFCGIIEIISAILMFLGCIIYPSGWDNSIVKKICGEKASEYRLGECGIRWAYILAILGIIDAAVLAILAFILAAKRVKQDYAITGTVTKSELYNSGFGDTTGSHIIRPGLLSVPADDAYSEYSQQSKTKQSINSGFQL